MELTIETQPFAKITTEALVSFVFEKEEKIEGVLTEVDDLALVGLCQSWAEYLEATEQVRKTGMLVKAPSGYPILNPYVVLANQALKRVKAFLTEFGMTPSSRSRVSAEKKAENEGNSRWTELARRLD